MILFHHQTPLQRLIHVLKYFMVSHCRKIFDFQSGTEGVETILNKALRGTVSCGIIYRLIILANLMLCQYKYVQDKKPGLGSCMIKKRRSKVSFCFSLNILFSKKYVSRIMKMFLYPYCSLSLWRVARGSKHMFLELIHGLFIT